MAEVVHPSPERIVEWLAALKRELGMTPSEFYDRYRAGVMGDCARALHWAGMCYLALRSGMLARSKIPA